LVMAAGAFHCAASMLRTIAAVKKKNDQIDAGKIADCLRCYLLPECGNGERAGLTLSRRFSWDFAGRRPYSTYLDLAIQK